MRLTRNTGHYLLRLAAAVLVVAVAARVSVPVPGSPVPQSLQTLAVCLVGAWLGARAGSVALAAYLAAGALGLPVFADGGAGPAHLVGPTAGYLVGFVVAAALVGWGVRTARLGAVPRVVRFAAVMVGAHVLILGLGWARLATISGVGPAYVAGVAPFLWGGVVKALLAAAICWTAMAGRVEPPEERAAPVG